MLQSIVFASSAPPAGGSAIGQVIGATLGAMVATAALLWVIAAHRGSRIRWLGRLASASERLKKYRVPVVELRGSAHA